MKYSLILLVSCFALAFAGVSYKAEYDASLALWKSVKPSSYSYSTVDSNELSGITDTTTIYVQNDKVVKRTYQRVKNGSVKASWEEPANGALGSHSAGFPPITIDTLYTQCLSNVLIQDPHSNDVQFKAENNGLVSKCALYPKACEDCSWRGAIVSAINLV